VIRIFNIVFFILNLVCVAALLLSYASTYINPEYFYIPAFFGLAYPIVLIANVFMVIWWVVQLKFKFLFSLMAILAGYNYIPKTIQIRKKEGNDPASLKVMSYNVACFGFDKNTNTRDDIIKLVSDAKPDIACFQEFCSNGNWHINMERTFSEAINSEYSHFNIVTGADKNYKTGTFIISRYPILKVEEIKYPTLSFNSAFYADIEINGSIVRVFNVHLQSIRFKPGDYAFINAESKTQDEAMEESRSIIQKMSHAYIIRAGQAKAVHDAIAASPYKVIVCGDFNDTPVSFAYSTMQAGLQDAFIEAGGGLGRTYAGDFPGFRIDYIMADRHFDIKGFEVVDQKLSDHYPVIAYIGVKP
jgi:endonuclease/exonuclease/phosphatase family metal-dependent hydrolase